MKKIKSKENEVKEVIEQKISQLDGLIGSIKDSQGKVKEKPMDILSNDICKMEITPRKQWITKVMFKKMEETRKTNTTNIKLYRRLDN